MVRRLFPITAIAPSAIVLLVASLVFALDGQIGIHDPSTIMICSGKFYTYGTGGSTLMTANQFPSGLGLDAAGDIFALPGQSQVQPQPGVTELGPTGQLDATVTAAPLTATSAGYPVDTTNDQFVFSQNEHPSGLKGFIDPEIIRFTTAGTVASDTGLFPFAGTSLFVQPALDIGRRCRRQRARKRLRLGRVLAHAQIESCARKH